MEPQWLEWAKRLQAIGQNGLMYSQNHFDTERYHQVQRIAAEILANASGGDIDATVSLFDQQVGYATPKVDVRGVVFREDRILLVKEMEDRRWSLPGGWADPCESPREAVVREIFEESGYRTEAIRLLAVYDRSKHPHDPPAPFHVYKLFIMCEITGGAASTSSETEAVDFFGAESLPELSISRVTPGQILRFFDYRRNGEIATDFD